MQLHNRDGLPQVRALFMEVVDVPVVVQRQVPGLIQTVLKPWRCRNCGLSTVVDIPVVAQRQIPGGVQTGVNVAMMAVFEGVFAASKQHFSHSVRVDGSAHFAALEHSRL